MIEPLDRSRRDSTLFQFTTKQLRDFIDPNHLLIRIDERAGLRQAGGSLLEDCYCPDFRPAGDPSRGDDQGVADLLAVQHRLFSEAVLGHLRKHRLPACLIESWRGGVEGENAAVRCRLDVQ